MSTSTAVPQQHRLLLLLAVLFIAYLCVGMALGSVAPFVTARLGLGNAWAGLGVGVAFLATVATRAHAGSLSDHRGPKPAVARGLVCCMAGAATALVAGLPLPSTGLAYAALLAGRLLLGVGESFVTVGVIGWAIGMAGPARSGMVLARVGAAIYGALALGGPIGLFLFESGGFALATAAGALLPGLALLAIRRTAGIVPQAAAERPPFAQVLARIGPHGAIVCLQGIGFAAIGAFFVLHFRAQGWPHAGLGLTAFGSGFVLVRLACGRLPDRFGGLPVAIGSLAIEALGQLLIWQAAGPASALAGAFLTGLGCSMVFPAMGREVVQRVPPHLRGTALGAFSAFQDVAYGLTGPLAGLLADRAGPAGVFLAGAGAAAAGLLVALRLLRR
ncbi:MFS transporter [Variovorax sp. TBS-050B]|uniref:MFS transporter n=1 Tax=Variovorax sp. TBS-050B TaxID=2940551 RepID=UPI002473069A|nr:MFS transporter [Variovorax sp. TBS-050B]